MNWYERFLAQIGIGGRTRMTAAGPRSVSRDIVESAHPNRSMKQRARDRAKEKRAKEARKLNWRH